MISYLGRYKRPVPYTPTWICPRSCLSTRAPYGLWKSSISYPQFCFLSQLLIPRALSQLLLKAGSQWSKPMTLEVAFRCWDRIWEQNTIRLPRRMLSLESGAHIAHTAAHTSSCNLRCTACLQKGVDWLVQGVRHLRSKRGIVIIRTVNWLAAVKLHWCSGKR